MKIMMADGKTAETLDTPTYVISSGEKQQEKKGVNKKYVIIGFSVVLLIGIVIAGILIGMHIFTEGQKEIVKFSYQFKGSQNNDIKQDVVSDPNANVVSYHVTTGGKSVDIVNDFDKGLQVVKIEDDDGQTNCYVTPLNVSSAMDPSQIVDSSSMTTKQSNKGGDSLLLQIDSKTIIDRSFITKKALDMCSGVSLYWAHKKCKEVEGTLADRNQTTSGIAKRDIYYMGTYCGLPGLGGCCVAYWACYVRMTEYVDANGRHYCYTYYETGTCCSSSPCCNQVYYSRWNTPGLVC